MADIVLTAIVRKEGRRFSSLCPELDVASAGDTMAEALSELGKAVRLYRKVSGAKAVRKAAGSPLFVTQLRVAS